MWLLKISLILVDSLLKVGPGKAKKILEKSWNFLTKKVMNPDVSFMITGHNIIILSRTIWSLSYPEQYGLWLGLHVLCPI